MRYRTSLSAVAVVFAIAGCGGSGAGAGADKSAAGVRATMRAYLDDLRHNRPEDACGLMTDAARIKTGGGKATACPAHSIVALAFLGPKGITRLEDKIPQLPIAVSGDRATAPPLTGSGASSTFLYRGGRWLIGSS